MAGKLLWDVWSPYNKEPVDGSLISQMGQAKVASELQVRVQLSSAKFRQEGAREAELECTLQGKSPVEEA